MRKKIIFCILFAVMLAALSSCSFGSKNNNNQKAHVHDYVGTVSKAANCREEGEMTYKCYGCGDSYTEVIPVSSEHDYKGKTTKEPTCAEPGERTYTCSVCGESYTEPIAATGNHITTSIWFSLSMNSLWRVTLPRWTSTGTN